MQGTTGMGLLHVRVFWLTVVTVVAVLAGIVAQSFR